MEEKFVMMGLILGLMLLASVSYSKEIVIVDKGKTEAKILISWQASNFEKIAAGDLAKYIEKMTGAKVEIISSQQELEASLKRKDIPLFIIGSLAIKENPQLQKKIDAVKKKKPILRADAIVIKTDGNRIYLAGSNDESSCYAVAEILRRWGCRFFMPTEFGECIPGYSRLVLNEIDYAYGSPFEVRGYWISWLGDYRGRDEFMRLNMMNNEVVPSGHVLATYTKDIAPGGDPFKIPISEKSTAEHVAAKIEKDYAAGKRISLGMEDGLYSSDSPKDKELMSLQWDKYFMTPSMTDAFMEFYNNVAEILMKKYPESKAKIGFLAYSNMTLPPVRDIVAKEPLVAYLAPIDIDPIHGMDDIESPPRQEYKEILYKWAKVMQGRVVIYDYDQGMLVWRDIPNPSIASIRQDIKHYRDAGILGIYTESRGAFATTFINLYIRGRLMWNPDEDVDKLIEEFYPAFYGPMAKPMSQYWNAIFKAWEDSIVTEHEYFVAPAIYTEQLINFLEKKLIEAEKLAEKISQKVEKTHNETLYLERMKFTRLSFEVLKNYIAMVKAAATDVDYATAVSYGEKGLAARNQLTAMNGIFTTTRLESGYPWWTGEVQQYRELLAFTDGTKGTLIKKLPLEWPFMRDPENIGLKEKYYQCPVDLSYWQKNSANYTLKTRKDYPEKTWEIVRSDLYLQAQGVRRKDRQAELGYGWYRTELELTSDEIQGNIHIMFPGLFNECWLYVNGKEVAHRENYKPMWWFNDYRFQWDVDITGKLKAGNNTIALRIYNPHHFAGMFRRPFIYRVK
ncbi:MAG TPA: DUF4838 domain-containing protein [bacterium]|nr:DUF4838 domain-containing protein [bacterium]